MGFGLARLSRVPSERRKHGCQRERSLSRVPKKEAWMPTGEDVRVRGQKRRMREEMTLTLTLIAMDGGVSDGAV